MSRTLNTPATTNAATIVVAGAATGSKILGVYIDGAACQIATTGSETAPDAAVKLKAAIDAALTSGYTTSISSATITVVASGGAKVFAVPYTTDTTQACTVSGGAASEAVIAGSATAGAGRPSSRSSGYAVGGPLQLDGGAATVLVVPRLVNGSGAAATAYWRLWWWDESLGWYVDPAVGVRLISDTGSTTAYQTADPIAVSGYGSRVAVELVGKASTGTDLDSLEAFWCHLAVV